MGLSSIVPVEAEPLPTAQLIPNESFEGGYSGWQAGSPSVGEAGAGLFIEPHGSNNPTSSANLATLYVDPGPTSYPGFYSTPVAVVPGGLYTLGGWARDGGPVYRVRALRAEFLRVDGTVAAGPEVAYSAADVWEYKSTPVGVPADAELVRLWAFIYTTNVPTRDQYAQWDELTLTGPNPVTLGADPPVAPFDGKAVSAWTAIQNAALDALTLVWLDPEGTLRFTSWGSLPDATVSLGCPPVGEPAARWIGGLSTVVYGMSAAAIRNRVRAWSAPDVWTPYQDDVASLAKYGARPLDVERAVPDFAAWSARVLADRADAGLAVTLGEVRPYDLVELAALLDIGLTGPQVVRIADADHPPPIDDSVGIVGTAGRVTSAGWSFRFVTAIPRVEWSQAEPPPVEPPIPPPDPWHTETRTYVATSDALLALTSGGSKYGAGAATSLPVGVWTRLDLPRRHPAAGHPLDQGPAHRVGQAARPDVDAGPGRLRQLADDRGPAHHRVMVGRQRELAELRQRGRVSGSGDDHDRRQAGQPDHGAVE